MWSFVLWQVRQPVSFRSTCGCQISLKGCYICAESVHNIPTITIMTRKGLVKQQLRYSCFDLISLYMLTAENKDESSIVRSLNQNGSSSHVL